MHGQLTGLWSAAQAGLSLSSSLQDLSARKSAPASDRSAADSHRAGACHESQLPVHSSASCSLSCSSRTAEKQPSSSDASACECDPLSGQATGSADGTHACQRTAGPACTAQAGLQIANGHAGEIRGWTQGGPGPPAEQLLRKLRWATLGPQFDWTARVYDAHAPYRPLPAELRTLATAISSAVAGLGMHPAVSHAQGSVASTHEDGGSARSTAHTSAGAVGGEACGKDMPALCDERVQSRGGSAVQAEGVNYGQGVHDWGDWEPDVALVNYYREGDTLGGHKDDAEQNLCAPIVALSLGCDAIFLLGGARRCLKILC